MQARFGIVYPNGIDPVKIVRAFTAGAKREYRTDGSVSYSIPPPTIYELVGGGFAYADGRQVSDRKHLENLPPQIRENALKWFDEGKGISEKAFEGVPQKPENLDEIEHPEIAYVLSTDVGADGTSKTNQELPPEKVDKKETAKTIANDTLVVMNSIMNTLKEINERLTAVEKGQPKQSPKMELARKAHSVHMKEVWAKKKAAKQAQNGQNITEASKTVSSV